MTNGITYVAPDPCPHCGGRVSTGMSGEEDHERYMYVCGTCDTWFEQKGYPTTSKRYVTEEAEVDALRARVAELEAESRHDKALIRTWVNYAQEWRQKLNLPEGTDVFSVMAEAWLSRPCHEDDDYDFESNA